MWKFDGAEDPFAALSKPLSSQPGPNLSDQQSLDELRIILEQKEADLQLAIEIGQTLLSNYHDLQQNYSAASARMKNEELQKRVDSWRSKHAQLQQDYSSLEMRYNDLIELNESQSASLFRFQKSPLKSPVLDEVPADQSDSFSVTFDELRRENQLLMRRMSAMKMENGRLEESLRQKDLDCQTQQDTIRQLNAKIDSLKDQKFSLNNSRENMNDTGSMSGEETEQILFMLRELSDTNNHLRHVNEDLESKLANLQHELEYHHHSQKEQDGMPLSAVDFTPIRRPSAVSAMISSPIDMRNSVFGELEATLKGSLQPSAAIFGSDEDNVDERNNSPVKMNEKLSPLARFERRISFKHRQSQQTDSESVTLSGIDIAEDFSKISSARFISVLAQCINLLLQRYRNANTLSLNRRLRKEFDLPSLTRLSNSIIEHILDDCAKLPQKVVAMNDEMNAETTPSNSFKNLLASIINLLKEIGSLKKSANDIGLAYYSKVEALSLAEEQRISSRRIEIEEQKRRQQQNTDRNVTVNSLRNSVSSFFGTPRNSRRNPHRDFNSPLDGKKKAALSADNLIFPRNLDNSILHDESNDENLIFSSPAEVPSSIRRAPSIPFFGRHPQLSDTPSLSYRKPKSVIFTSNSSLANGKNESENISIPSIVGHRNLSSMASSVESQQTAYGTPKYSSHSPVNQESDDFADSSHRQRDLSNCRLS